MAAWLREHRKLVAYAVTVLGAVLSYWLTPDQVDQWVSLAWLGLGFLGIERAPNDLPAGWVKMRTR